jgi:hypothetical protein
MGRATHQPLNGVPDQGRFARAQQMFARECVLIGAMLADKQTSRKNIDPAAFHHPVCRRVANELQKGANADPRVMREFLAHLGIDYKVSDLGRAEMPALKAVERRQAVAARCERAIKAIITEWQNLKLSMEMGSRFALRKMPEEETIATAKTLLNQEACKRHELG